MLRTIDLITLAKERAGGVTDYRLSKMLGVPTNRVCGYRAGRSKPENSTAARLGALAGIDPAEAVALVNLERAQTPDEVDVWLLMLARLRAAQDARPADSPALPLSRFATWPQAESSVSSSA